MTRREFEDDVCSFDDLIDLCSEEGCSECSDIYSYDDYNTAVNEELEDRVSYDGWIEIRDWLDSLPTGYDWYRKSEWDGSWKSLNDYDDFDRYKENVRDWMDEYGRWDDDEEEAPYEDPEDLVPVEQEAVSFEELMMSGSAVVEAARRAGATDEQVSEIEANFMESVTAFLCDEKGA